MLPSRIQQSMIDKTFLLDKLGFQPSKQGRHSSLHLKYTTE